MQPQVPQLIGSQVKHVINMVHTASYTNEILIKLVITQACSAPYEPVVQIKLVITKVYKIYKLMQHCAQSQLPQYSMCHV